MTKIFVVIPARNEEKTIGNVINRIPKHMSPSISTVVVIDDGTTDRTASVAEAAGAKVINLGPRRGLAEAFRAGLKEALKKNADFIVTIDADAQYSPEDISRIVAPLLAKKADIVLGSRFAGGIEDMSVTKKMGNIFFTWVTRRLAKVPITDAQTGFRAMTRKVAKSLEITSDYTYTQEMIMNAAFKGFKIIEEPIFFGKRPIGKSRLIPNLYTYATKVTLTIVKCYIRNMLNSKKAASVSMFPR
jgi:glycosyltransferase involved in cell wall biosynthesis